MENMPVIIMGFFSEDSDVISLQAYFPVSSSIMVRMRAGVYM
jgi:hypothetical protein